MHRHVLVIMPHPDDETLACGGTIALHTKAGTPATYVCGTLGEMGRNFGRPTFATRESLPRLREQELKDACKALGCDLIMLGLRDKTVEFVDPDSLAARLRTIIAEKKPSLILTYHPLYSVHPDHMAMGAAVVRAVAGMPAEERPPVHTRAFGPGVEKLGPPDVVVDVSSVIDMKLAAIAAHRSQTQGMLARIEEQVATDPAAREQFLKQRSLEQYWIYKFE